ncbi:MAG: sulfur carrier protein ThiS adenylyltransferase ThiF [Desulfuromonadales bacterium]|nr:sulfur carrier protein ThiS adenylyltransferase ThiF [Desulfuromonadales bacterium]NIR33664.1 sulfur carrier protein ThiS adenylyltransferase ThiF [Desulfuromonadales bacterium]NIS43559.1 sulfur carrier protein ThiS adenylyltransferase ThiF [Desulfuromonadales bacterium]
MTIWLNEKEIRCEAGTTLFQLRDRHKPQADLIIANGFPAAQDRPLVDGDRVVLIRRGETPSESELEALMSARHTPGVHQKIKSSTVAIAGVGGLGSAVAVALARIGVGHLIVADFDVVEPSNLNRQQYFVDQIGLPKVFALKDNLARINPYVTVTTFNGRLTTANIPEFFGEADVVVEAFDAADQKAMITESVLAKLPGTPLVAASGLAGHAPSNTVVTRRAAGRLYLIGDGETAAQPGQGLMAPRVGIAAHHQANAVLRLLLGEEPE